MRPQRGAPELRAHERLAGVVGPAAVDGGLGEQLVGRLERGLEVAIQARAVQAGQRQRLEVAAPARGGQRRLGGARLLEVGLARLGVADLEGRARERGAELGVGVQPLRRQRVDEAADRVALAAHEEVEPVLGDELDREVPLARRDGVLERLRAHAGARRTSARRGRAARAARRPARAARGCAAASRTGGGSGTTRGASRSPMTNPFVRSRSANVSLLER